jgi:hypothetical protein
MQLFEATCRDGHVDTLTLEKFGRQYLFRIANQISGCRSTVVLNKARMTELLIILHNELKDKPDAR